MIPRWRCDSINEKPDSTNGSAYFDDHRVWPRGGKIVSVKVLIPQRVLCRNLVAFQMARVAMCPANTVQLEHGAEHLAHDLRRQVDPEGTSDAITSEVAVFRFAMHIDCVRVRENLGL